MKDRDCEKLQELLDDDTWKEASEVGHALKELIDKYLQNSGPQAVAELTELKKAIEKSYNYSRNARIDGTIATVLAIIITVAAFGLGFITLGTLKSWTYSHCSSSSSCWWSYNTRGRNRLP